MINQFYSKVSVMFLLVAASFAAAGQDEGVPFLPVFDDRGIRISNFSNVTPSELITNVWDNSNGKWELVSYEATVCKGTMLYTKSNPKPVTIEPKLKGWHRIYIATFGAGGRLWFRLTNDTSPTMMTKGGTGLGWIPFEQGEEIYWKSADLTGQSITVGKPGGAAIGLMWLRFVPMTEAEIAAEKAEFSNPATKRLVAHSDMGWSTSFYGANPTEDEFCSQIDAWRDSDVAIATVEDGNAFGDKPMKREKLNRAMIKRANEYGINLLVGARMGHSHSVFPWGGPRGKGKSIVEDHPEWSCRDRDGESATFISYAYPEVRQWTIDRFMQQMDLGYDGVSPIFVRGIFTLFEKPVRDAFAKRYPKLDARKMPLDDPRLTEVRSQYMTEFMRSLRKELNKYAKKAGRPRLMINPIVLSTREDNLRLGLDIETWMREKLVDGVVVGALSIREEDKNLRDDANPEFISIEKYKKSKRTDEHSPIYRRHDYGHDYILPAIPWFKKLSKETGIPVSNITHWEGSCPPEKMAGLLKKFQDAGQNNFCMWDCEMRMLNRPEWFVTSRLGHLNYLPKYPTKNEDFRRRFRILKLDGISFASYHPSWHG